MNNPEIQHIVRTRSFLLNGSHFPRPQASQVVKLKQEEQKIKTQFRQHLYDVYNAFQFSTSALNKNVANLNLLKTSFV